MAEQASGHALAAGWRRDPFGRHFGRYWDGEQWTEHVISAERVPSIDPVGQRNVGAEEHRTEPAPNQGRVGSWENDPSGRHSSRYWDGQRWTEHVMSAEKVPSIDPVPERNSVARRTEPSGARDTPAAAHTAVMPASTNPELLGSPGSQPLTRGAREGFRLRARAWWPLGLVVCGLIIAGLAISGGSPRPTVGNSATTITRPVETSAPSAGAQLAPTVPLTTQASVTLPGAPANTGAPATTPGTGSGSQPPGTSPQSVDPPTTIQGPGEPDLNATTSSGNSITGTDSPSSITNG